MESVRCRQGHTVGLTGKKPAGNLFTPSRSWSTTRGRGDGSVDISRDRSHSGYDRVVRGRRPGLEYGYSVATKPPHVWRRVGDFLHERDHQRQSSWRRRQVGTTLASSICCPWLRGTGGALSPNLSSDPAADENQVSTQRLRPVLTVAPQMMLALSRPLSCSRPSRSCGHERAL